MDEADKVKIDLTDRSFFDCGDLPNLATPTDLPVPEDDYIRFEELWIGSPVRLHEAAHHFFEWQFSANNLRENLWFRIQAERLSSDWGKQGKIAQAHIIGCRDGLPAAVTMCVYESSPSLHVSSHYRDWAVLEPAWLIFRKFLLENNFIKESAVNCIERTEKHAKEGLPPVEDPTDKRLLEAVVDNPDITDSELARQIGIKRQQANQRRNTLKKMGYKVR